MPLLNQLAGTAKQSLSNKELLTSHRHIYRALLRESTYLPDAVAQRYSRQRILKRCRVYRENIKEELKNINGKEESENRVNESLWTLRKKGEQALSRLRRANLGYLPVLRRVLFNAYGRSGQRRHDLLQKLLKEPDAEKELLEPLKGRANVSQRVFNSLPCPGPTLTQILKSQAQTKFPDWQPPLRKLKVTINETNLWGRLMPAKRVVNATWVWYLALISRVMPPLPSADYEHLKRLALGRCQRTTVQRRPMGTVLLDADQAAKIESELAQQGLEITDPARFALAIESTRGAGPHPHILTRRLMRRIYQDILKVTPLLQPGQEPAAKGRYRVVWGAAVMRQELRRPTANAQKAELLQQLIEKEFSEHP